MKEDQKLSFLNWLADAVCGVRGEAVPHEFNVLALLKGDERYIYVYDDVSRAGLMDSFRDQAADPDLSFSWFDAAVLSEKAREQAAASAPTCTQARSRI
jgi:hypothetical protein